MTSLLDTVNDKMDAWGLYLMLRNQWGGLIDEEAFIFIFAVISTKLICFLRKY